jgi:hypothetical protein
MLEAVQVAVPPQSAEVLQHGCINGWIAVYVQVPLLQVGAFWQLLAALQADGTLHWQPTAPVVSLKSHHGAGWVTSAGLHGQAWQLPPIRQSLPTAQPIKQAAPIT